MDSHYILHILFIADGGRGGGIKEADLRRAVKLRSQVFFFL